MASGENAAVDPSAVVAMETSAPSARRKPRARKPANPERPAKDTGSAPEVAEGETAEVAGEDQESLARAADTLAARLGMTPPPGVDQALGAGRRASMATIRAHRLVVEFHLGQLERTLRAGRALTGCHSFEDAVEVHRLFMQETLRASATHLRDLADLGLSSTAGPSAPGKK